MKTNDVKEKKLKIRSNFLNVNSKQESAPLVNILKDNHEYTVIENQEIYVIASDTPFLQTDIFSKFRMINTNITVIDNPNFVMKTTLKNRLMFLLTNNTKHIKGIN